MREPSRSPSPPASGIWPFGRELVDDAGQQLRELRGDVALRQAELLRERAELPGAERLRDLVGGDGQVLAGGHPAVGDAAEAAFLERRSRPSRPPVCGLFTIESTVSSSWLPEPSRPAIASRARNRAVPWTSPLVQEFGGGRLRGPVAESVAELRDLRRARSAIACGTRAGIAAHRELDQARAAAGERRQARELEVRDSRSPRRS